MRERPDGSHEVSVPTRPAPSSVSAVVLTHRRPRLATAVVRSLIEREGLSPDRVVVVVNGSGGLDDPELESSIRLIRLPHNRGPAGGFRAGMEVAFSDASVHWAYLCEDDVGLLTLPTPRLADVVERAQSRDRSPGSPVGAVVAFGRQFVGRGAHTENLVPPALRPHEFELVPVDVASWGATLLSRTRVRCRDPPRLGLVLRTRGLRLLLPGPAGGFRGARRRRVCSGGGGSTDVSWSSRRARIPQADRCTRNVAFVLSRSEFLSLGPATWTPLVAHVARGLFSPSSAKGHWERGAQGNLARPLGWRTRSFRRAPGLWPDGGGADKRQGSRVSICVKFGLCRSMSNGSRALEATGASARRAGGLCQSCPLEGPAKRFLAC